MDSARARPRRVNGGRSSAALAAHH